MLKLLIILLGILASVLAYMDRLQGQAEVVIGKQRHGPIGIVKLAFDADTVRFGNLAHGYEEVSYE